MSKEKDRSCFSQSWRTQLKGMNIHHLVLPHACEWGSFPFLLYSRAYIRQR